MGDISGPRPREVSLAHNCGLFLDELSEFHRNVLEVSCQSFVDYRNYGSTSALKKTVVFRELIFCAKSHHIH